MGKLKVLELNEKYLKFVGILSEHENLSTAERMFKYFIIFVYQFAFVYTCEFSVMYIVRNPGDFSGATNAFIMFLSALYGIISLIGYIYNEENIKLLHHGLQDIVDNGDTASFQIVDFSFLFWNNFFTFLAENSRVRELYQNTENKCQDITKSMAFILHRGYPCCILLPTIAHGIFCTIIGNPDTSTWYFACAFEGMVTR